MKNILVHLLGFFLPTLGVVLGEHLSVEVGVEAAIDGVVSTVYFCGIFLVGIVLVGGRDAFQGLSGLTAILLGIGAGVLTWLVIAAIWSVPGIRTAAAGGLPVVANSLVVFLVGMAAPLARSWMSQRSAE